MKKNFLIFVNLLMTLFFISSCDFNSTKTNIETTKSDEFNIRFSNYHINTTLFDVTSSVEIKACEMVYVRISIPTTKWVSGNDNLDLISFKYNDENFDLIYLSSNDSGYIYFNLYAMKVFTNEQLEIEFNNINYIINVKSDDYDFSNMDILDNDLLSNKYSEFKEMIDSIMYHEYKTPYVGITSNYNYDYLNQICWNYNFSSEGLYDLGYLDYLKDSIFYPSKMNLGYPNIGTRGVRMIINDKDMLKPNSLSTKMEGFEIDYGVIDPDCTNPKNHLYSMIYQVIPLSGTLSKDNQLLLHQEYYLLQDIYPSKFFKYEVDDLKINIIGFDDYLYAFFNDNNYAYMLSCSYNFN